MPLPGHSVAIESSAVRAGAFAAADRARTRAALTSAVPMTPGGLRQAAHVLQCLSARNSLTDELSGGRACRSVGIRAGAGGLPVNTVSAVRDRQCRGGDGRHHNQS